jgi:hypothetical protein
MNYAKSMRKYSGILARGTSKNRNAQPKLKRFLSWKKLWILRNSKWFLEVLFMDGHKKSFIFYVTTRDQLFFLQEFRMDHALADSPNLNGKRSQKRKIRMQPFLHYCLIFLTNNHLSLKLPQELSKIVDPISVVIIQLWWYF